MYRLCEPTWDDLEITAAYEVLKSKKCTMGEKTKQFEKDFCDMFGCKYAVMSNSGSSANLLMLSTIKCLKEKYKIKDNDEIIVPAVSWATTYYPIFQNNFKIVLVDINKDTFNIDEDILEKSITDKTKAIFAVNILGNSCNFDSIKKICEKYNLILLEDNCESMYASYKGKMCGTIGKMGSFSSFFSHHICTVEGGITVTDDEEFYHYLLSLRAHGWTRDLPKINNVCNKSDDNTKELFNFIVPGYNLRPNDVFSAIGIEQLKKLPLFIKNRTDNYNYFILKVNDLNEKYGSVIKIQKIEDGCKPSFFSFNFLLEGILKNEKNNYMKFLHSHNIESRPIVTGNFARNPVIKFMDCKIPYSLCNSDIIDQQGVFIGNHSFIIYDLIDMWYNITEKYINYVR
jgi:CDP-6-deoxy-D-xylo-4-hexulose-3-dehydrase